MASQDELREALAMSVEDADSHKVAQRLIEELLNTPGGVIRLESYFNKV